MEMEYNYMEITVSIHGRPFFYRVRNEHNSYIITLHNIIDSVYKYACTDFGIILEEDIERDIKENEGDDYYTPFPTLEMFNKLGEELVVSSGNVFPMRYQFKGVRDFVDYLRNFPLEIVKVNKYNQYTLDGECLHRVLYVDEFSDYAYNLICDIQAEINNNDLYNELDAIDTNKDEDIVLNEIKQTLARYGYKLTKMIP